jgi:tetratricopeptide (TPR) repeat protein
VIRRLFSALVGLSAVLSAACQTTLSYKAEPIVIRHSNTVIDMKADGTGEQTETMTVSVQSEAAVKQFSVVSAFYAKQSQHADFVYVRVRHPDGTTVETPLSDTQDQAAPVTQQAPFYSDLMIKQVPVKGLRVGDTLEWQTKSVRTTAEAPGQFWGAENFVRDIVIEDQTVDLRVPMGTKLTVRTKPETKIQLTESDADGRHSYRWSWKQLDPTIGPEAEAQKKAKESRTLSPAEEQEATDGALPDISWTTFPSWEAVGAWYRGLEGDRMKPDDAVRAKVAEITAGKTTQEEKVRAVYAWVSGQIRYVGVALGIGRYQPHTAAAVLDNQYGDCKDKHTLLASMLVVLGLQPDAVLAGPGIRLNRDVPSPASFNHLITRVSVEGKDIWLDSTSEVADYRVLLSVVRDKDVLVVPQAGPAVIAHTPTDLPFKAASTFEVKGSLDGSLASDSTLTMTHHDDVEVYLRAAFRQLSPSQYEEVVQGLMGGYGFGGKVSQVEIEHVNDPSLPLILRFHYHRDHGEDWGANRVTATFGPMLVPTVDKKDLPHFPLQLGSLRTDSSTEEMTLPQGWNMELPEAIHQHMSFAECDVTYHLVAGALIAERRTTILKTKVPIADLKSYADWYEACGAGSVPYLQLVSVVSSGIGSKTSKRARSGNTISSANEAQARHLINLANTDIRQGSYDEAETVLKQAQAIDPDARDLWGDLGAVAMHRGDHKEAMRLYAKEAEVHPESEFAYRNLARLQSLTGDNGAAIETLMRWQKRAPANAAPSIQAIQMLLSSLDNAGALRQAKASEALLSEDARKNETFQLVLGEAMMRGGELEAGRTIIVDMVRDSTDLTHQNDASYELALAGVDLKLAEETERAVLETLSAESRTWTGGEAPALMRQKSSLINAGWDTMGWILFKEGKLTDAEAWVRAAMVVRGNTEVCEHLGDVLMAEKKSAEAVVAYAEALATLPMTDGMGVRVKTDPPRAKELRTKLEVAKQESKTKDTPDGKAALQALRTRKLGSANGLDGTAEFQALLSSDGVFVALPVGMVPHPMQEKIDSAKWSESYPPGVTARLAAKVMLNCHSGTCELVTEP